MEEAVDRGKAERRDSGTPKATRQGQGKGAPRPEENQDGTGGKRWSRTGIMRTVDKTWENWQDCRAAKGAAGVRSGRQLKLLDRHWYFLW